MMDPTQEAEKKYKSQFSSQFYKQASKDEGKQQELDIQVNRSCQGQLFESQHYQPQKLHEGDLDVSFKSIQGEINDTLQKSINKGFNNNSSLLQNQQPLLQFSTNNNYLNEKQTNFQYQSTIDHKHYQQEQNQLKLQQNIHQLQNKQEDISNLNSNLNKQEKESSCNSEQNNSIFLNSQNNIPKSEMKSPISSKKNLKQNNIKQASKLVIQDDMIFEKDLNKLSSRVNTMAKNQNLFSENLVQQKYKQNFQKATSIGWYFVGIQEQNYDQNNWLDKLSISSYPYYQKYIYSMYWSITTMTTVGYGDISATNWIEALYITITMILFSCVFAYSINNIGFILQEIEKSSKQLNDDIATIQRYLIRKDVNIQLKSRVRHYLSFLAQEQKDRDKQQEDKILSVLSNKLRDEITQEINSKILNNYLVFSSNFSKSTLNKLIFIMKEILVNPNEVIINEDESDDSSIYFIQSGVIEIYLQQIQKKNTINVINTLTNGQVFGEISFFSGLQRQASARSVNLSTLYKINREEFIQILKQNTEDFERFKMMQDQIIFQKDTSITRSECYNCKNSYHIANQCPRTHRYFDKQFIILKQNFSTFQERFFKKRINLKFKCNAKIQKKKNFDIIQLLKQNLQKSNDENYLNFLQDESFITGFSQSQNDESSSDDDDEKDDDSQSQFTVQFQENEISQKVLLKGQQGQKVDKQVKSINHINSNIVSNIDDADLTATLENQIQSIHSNFIYENQDLPKVISNAINSQARITSFEATDIIDLQNNQESNQFYQNKQRCNSESNRVIYKKDTNSEISQQISNLDEEGSNLENSKKFDKQKSQQQNINAQLSGYLKSQMKSGPHYSNLNKQIQKQVSNQSVDDHSLNLVQDNQIQKSNKKEKNKSKQIANNNIQSAKKDNSNNKTLIPNLSQKEIRSSIDQYLLQNIASMTLMPDKINSQSQSKNYEININQQNSKIQNSIKSLKDNFDQKSNQLILNKVSFTNLPRDQQQNKQEKKSENRNSQNQNENLIIERLSKLFQNSQLPLLLQLTNGKSFLQDPQYTQLTSMDYFDKIYNFKKFYPESNFDKVLVKLKAIQQQQKRQKKRKQTQKERRQNIGFGAQIRLSVFQGTANLIFAQDYDINQYKPTYLSYGTKMQNGIKHPLNIISQMNL
ncbi:cation channel family protein (macronuclear) [Tetrahymena thermophila SB210]|uniref:Cation channel family protein n=1 Tax=Tetrahymena thermophila (strain SB210) TaxID=312017 RepID=Q23JK6_TETTS|nr:cation channel family protein [Tetrahymena thermophila SB210]EAR96737.2 cation channel family protein [Tetrahymena thermophila SB210]|eukprot:XP_001016982.2 cation channel family protein [Tetrahymena thermophila SB210]